MTQVRINKYLASAGVAARRKVDELVVAGRVIVNGKKAVLGQKVDPQKDKIEVNGKQISQSEEFEYFIVNKPKGVVTTSADTHGRDTVLGLIKSGKRLYPVGRLDVESEGLVLLTNDGFLANKLMHPRFHVPKIYEVKFLGKVSGQSVEAIRNGVKLDDGMTKPAGVKVLLGDEQITFLEITLFEGMNRQIRKMAEKLHLHVLKLKRVGMGPILLGKLATGKSRKLTVEEITKLKKAAKG